MTPATKPSPTDFLTTLRGLTPQRPLSPSEARRIVELQAARLLREAGFDEPAVDVDALGALLHVMVASRAGLPISGLATQTERGGWAIVLSADDSPARRRFSYAHELKHILDDPFIDWLYPTRGAFSSDLLAERVCDQFAAAVLMPRQWIKRDWCQGHQDVRLLAARYAVSMSAMGVRLGELGLRRIDIGHTRESLAYFTHHARRAA